VNPYARALRYAGELLRSRPADDQQHVHMVLRGQHDVTNTSLRDETDADARQPTSQFREVALLTSPSGLQRDDFVIHNRGGSVSRLAFGNPAFDPTYYVLLMPYGDPGWSRGLHQCQTGSTVEAVLAHSDQQSINPLGDPSARWITPMMFYAHRLHWRFGDIHRGGQCLLMGGRLFQEYCCTGYARAEADRLAWHRHNQDLLRCDTVGNLRSAREAADRNGQQMPVCGRSVRLASSFVGGPRDIHNRYLDAMAVVAALRKPSLFITMTCNPQWPEIVRSLPYGVKAEDRPDLTARVFKAKLDELLKDLVERHVLGVALAIMQVVEFQYRGLPHAHILLVLDAEDDILTADAIDQVVCAQLPSINAPDLRRKVLQHMIHNDCQANPSDCMCCQRTGRCRWNFPHRFSETTTWTDHELYPQYARPRASDEWETTASGRVITNEWVASYNAYLLSKYDCHLNVEVCASLEAVRYLYKYIYKGPDRANVQLRHIQSGDEVSMFEDMRYFGASEAVWRLLAFNLFFSRPKVERLPLHLDDEVNVLFRQGNERRAAERVPVSKLLDWLTFCRAPVLTHLPTVWQTLTYSQFPGYFTHHRQRGWRGRATRERFKVVGRMPPARVGNEEVFFLRRWLCHVTCGEVRDHYRTLPAYHLPCVADLRMGYSSFKTLCVAKGLADDDQEWAWVLAEASTHQLASGMRCMFIEIVTYNQPANAMALFEQYWEDFFYDRELAAAAERINAVAGSMARRQTVRRVFALSLMHDELRAAGCTDWRTQLPMTADEQEISHELERYRNEPMLIQHELNYDRQQEQERYQEALAHITDQSSQLDALQRVQSALEQHIPLLLFLSAYAGCGKTYLENAILHLVRSTGQIALAVASTGIAALLLPGGVTLHSRFKVPLNADCDSTLNILAQSNDAALIRRATVLIWDEAVMHSRAILDAMDRTLRDLRDDPRPMGGLIVVFGGNN
jgi:hypothetical protein